MKCYRCGATGHIARKCLTSAEKVKKYQDELEKFKGSSKSKAEVNATSTQIPKAVDKGKAPAEGGLDSSRINSSMYYSSSMSKDPDICLIDNCASDTILKDRSFFRDLIPAEVHVRTVIGEGVVSGGARGPADLSLKSGVRLSIQQALYSS